MCWSALTEHSCCPTLQISVPGIMSPVALRMQAANAALQFDSELIKDSNYLGGIDCGWSKSSAISGEADNPRSQVRHKHTQAAAPMPPSLNMFLMTTLKRLTGFVGGPVVSGVFAPGCITLVIWRHRIIVAF